MTVQERRQRARHTLAVAIPLALAGIVIAMLLSGRQAPTPEPGLGGRRLLAIGESRFHPFIFEEDGEAKGFAIDVLRELARRRKLDIRIALTDWNSAITEFRRGGADILIGVSDLEERRSYIDFTERMLAMKSQLFVAAETYGWTRLEDIGEETPIGVQRGDITAEFLLREWPSLRLREFTDVKDVIEALARGEIEIAAIDYYSGLNAIQNLGLASAIKVIGDPILEAGYGLGVRKGDNETLIALNGGIEALKSDGTIKRLQDKWLGAGLDTSRAWRMALYAAAVLLTLAAVLLAWNISLRVAVAQRTRLLAENDELFRLYMEHSPVYMFFKDEELRSLRLSRNYEALLGKPRADMLGKRASELLPAAYAAAMDRSDQAALSGGEAVELTERLGERIVRTIKFPILRPGRRPYLAGFSMDVTEARQAEEQLVRSLREKETLIRELYHRTKNTLQVIGSILLLQTEDFPSNEQLQLVARNTRDRIQAMALVHDMLYRSHDLSRIAIGAYIEELAAQLYAGAGMSISRVGLSLNIEDRAFLIDTAIPLGLILGELISNSLKYAFPGGRSGTIRIGLHGREEARIGLEYSDDGIGLAPGFDLATATSLGFRLIRNIAEGQLMGTVEISGQNGMACSILFGDGAYGPRV